MPVALVSNLNSFRSYFLIVEPKSDNEWHIQQLHKICLTDKEEGVLIYTFRS